MHRRIRRDECCEDDIARRGCACCLAAAFDGGELSCHPRPAGVAVGAMEIVAPKAGGAPGHNERTDHSGEFPYACIEMGSAGLDQPVTGAAIDRPGRADDGEMRVRLTGWQRRGDTRRRALGGSLGTAVPAPVDLVEDDPGWGEICRSSEDGVLDLDISDAGGGQEDRDGRAYPTRAMHCHRTGPAPGKRGSAAVGRPATKGQGRDVGAEPLPLERAEFPQRRPVRCTILDHTGTCQQVEQATRGRWLCAEVSRRVDGICALAGAIERFEPLSEPLVEIADDKRPRRIHPDLEG